MNELIYIFEIVIRIINLTFNIKLFKIIIILKGINYLSKKYPAFAGYFAPK